MSPAEPPVAGPGPASLRPRDFLAALACVLAGLGFGLLVWLRRGPEPAQQYLAGYLIELSMSADNVFVFALVFAHMGVAPGRQRRLLFWGMAGAIVFRSAILIAGIGAISRFGWIIPVLGALILATGIRLAIRKGMAFDPSSNPLVLSLLRRVPSALAALIALETADLVFALDSLPAVVAVTHDPSIAIASNFFAILGLRSLYFVVSGAMRSLRCLGGGLAGVLSFVGLEMLAEPWFRVPAAVSLTVITAILAVAVMASVFSARRGR